MYKQLQQQIVASIYENTEQRITGSILQQVLLDVVKAIGNDVSNLIDKDAELEPRVDANEQDIAAEVSRAKGAEEAIKAYLAKGYLFGGLVFPNTPFTAGAEKIAFLASQSGRYPSFGNFSLMDGELAVFLWNGENWQKQIISYFQTGQVYGVRHYYNNASPDLTRIGDASLHRDLPVQSLMRRCVVNSTGDVVYYLGTNDSTKKADGTIANLDGTDGQVMVEVPAHYRRTSLNAEQGYMDTEISMFPFDGAILVPRYLVSAYEAVLDRETNTLCSVVNKDARFRGGNNNADWDGTYRDLRGLPSTNISLNNFRQYARNRGVEWGCYDWNMHTDIFWLFAIEYATLNSQKAFNENLDSAGFHQGGLGSGVSNFSNWNAYNSYNPIIPCGFTNSLGNKTGIKAFTLTSEQALAYGSEHTEYVPSYRGIENPFGHIWKWTDGYLGVGNGTDQEVYISRDRKKYASSLNDSYVDMGRDANANGYVKSILATNPNISQELRKYGDLIGIDDSGSSSTFFCDYHYTAHASGTTYGALLGGAARNGATDGFACADVSNAPTSADAHFGSRLCWAK